MKLNKIYVDVKEYLKTYALYLILLVSLLLQVKIALDYGIIEWFDSSSYYNAAEKLGKGGIDTFRTPGA